MPDQMSQERERMGSEAGAADFADVAGRGSNPGLHRLRRMVCSIRALVKPLIYTCFDVLVVILE